MRLLVSGCTASLRRIEPDYPDVLGRLLTPALGNTPASCVATGLPWAVDNGAFSDFDEVKFRRLLDRIAGLPRCLFVVAPDQVADAESTLILFDDWEQEIRHRCGQPVAFVGQDGQDALPVPWDRFDAWFVGGSTEWKLSRASASLMAEAKRRGKHCHVGRVNSRKRLRWAHEMGADTVDGTGMSRWGDIHLAKFCRWAREANGEGNLFPEGSWL